MGSLNRKYIRKVVQWILPFALTAALVWVMFRKVDLAEMAAILRNGVDWWWILAAMGLSVVSHMVRAARWRLQLDHLGIRAPFMALCCSVFGCYALNILFPRLGEVWRCSYISRRGKAPFSTVFGSIVADRLSDSAAVLVLFLLTLCVAYSGIMSFLDRYPVGKGIVGLISSPWIWLGLTGALLICVLAWRKWRRSRLGEALGRIARQLWHGFASVASMPGRNRFVFYTVLIWGCYFIQLYLAFFAFPFTRALAAEPALGYGLIPCLVAFVLSSIGMGIPSNGGLGPWNLAVMFGLAIYGIPDAEGTTFSIVQWSGQAVMLFILGLYTIGYILLSRAKDPEE